ncbi:MAG: M48 family metalloprotease, partial [Gammaproteobacteria bacterium]|nr:M48 family metalloprotease [Gammaproteobacteria bacterium]
LQKSTQGEVFQDLLAKSSKKNRAAIEKLTGAGLQLYARGLERADEYEADRLGVVIAARAGYDPFALLNVLTTIDSLDPHNPNLALMFSTHPPTSERLARLDRAMEGNLDKYASQSTAAKRFVKIRNRLVK